MTADLKLLQDCRDEFAHLADYWNESYNARVDGNFCKHAREEAQRWVLKLDAALSAQASADPMLESSWWHHECAAYLGKILKGKSCPSCSASEPLAQTSEGCTRSHPHSFMDADCEKKTIEARAANKAAQASAEPTIRVPCCNYQADPKNHPVKWNELNQVIACHNCGQVWQPIPKEPAAQQDTGREQSHAGRVRESVETVAAPAAPVGPTPRTDALLAMRNLRWDQLADFARGLERELAAAKSNTEAAIRRVGLQAQRIGDLSEELAAVKAKYKRLETRFETEEWNFRQAKIRAERAEAQAAALRHAQLRIERALLPDPHDERELSVDWLRLEIRAAIDKARVT